MHTPGSARASRGRCGSGRERPGPCGLDCECRPRCPGHRCSGAEPTGQIGSSVPVGVPDLLLGRTPVELSVYRGRSGSGSGIQYVIGFSRLENFCPSTMQSADVCPCPYCGPQWDTSALGDIIQLCLPLLGLGEQGLGLGRSQQGRTQSSRAGTLGLCSRDPGKCSDVPGPRQVGCAPLIPWEDRGDLPRVHCHTVVMEAHLPPPPSSSPPPILFSSLHRNLYESIF